MEAIIYNFYQYLKQGKVLGRKCQCGAIAFPPRGLCAVCGSDNAKWIEMTGKGKLLFAAVGANQFFSKDSFILATVQLDEGPIVAGVLYDESFDYSNPDQIWEYNMKGDVCVKAVVSQNPMGGEMVAFRKIS
jgi:uncharacterized OB-fold protein